MCKTKKKMTKKQKQKKSSKVEKSKRSLTTITVDRRGVLSSPVLLCNELHLKIKKQTKTKTRRGKWIRHSRGLMHILTSH